MNGSIGAVENAMLAALAAASATGAIPYTYLSQATWPKNFDAYLSSETVRYPACWSAFAGAHKVDRVAPGRWRAHCAFGLVVAASNARNEQSRRQGGSPQEPGSYQLAQDALMLLSDQTFGLDIDAFRPTSILPVEAADIPQTKQLSLYAVSFDTALYYDSLPVGANIADFLTFHANWDPAPYLRAGEPLPDDAAAAFTDNVSLPAQ